MNSTCSKSPVNVKSGFTPFKVSSARVSDEWTTPQNLKFKHTRCRVTFSPTTLEKSVSLNLMDRFYTHWNQEIQGPDKACSSFKDDTTTSSILKDQANVLPYKRAKLSPT